MRRIKQVIVIRKDLKMRRGKEIAQGSHASMAFMVQAQINKKKLSDEAIEWFTNGQTKICVCVNSEEELLKIFNDAKDKGLEVNLIKDAGYTEFKEPTITAIAIGPNISDKIDKITGHLTLY